jgi:hypothetical protein
MNISIQINKIESLLEDVVFGSKEISKKQKDK